MSMAMGSTNSLLASSASTGGTLRIAVVGCGPRGLQCLESLTRAVGLGNGVTLDVSIFEPADFLGAGTVYDPLQPQHLRMNFATKYIDFWKTEDGCRSENSASLLAWLRRKHPELAEPGGSVPRAVVGKYLNDCHDIVLARLKNIANVQIIPDRVRTIRACDSFWRIETDSGLAEFDEVAITTGHEGLRACKQLSTSRTVPVFPVEQTLSVTSIPAGSRVLVRGFGLTAIDAILSLTEGRGGAFELIGASPTYKPSGSEPQSILVHSRSGRPMLAKPTGKVEPTTASHWEPFAERLQALESRRGKLSINDDVWPILCDAAATLLCGVGLPTRFDQISNWYRRWSTVPMEHDAAKEAMRESYQVAAGMKPANITFALGESWRRLYPPLVTLLGRGGLLSSDWCNFKRLSAEMERIAFGPPAENVARLIALMDAGIVCCVSDLPSSKFDCEVNAVIAPPHESPPSGPLLDLVRNEVLHRDRVSGAVMVDFDGRPIDSDGNRREGLAIFGRATEGWVIGNDTLSRTLHNHICHWAESINRKVR